MNKINISIFLISLLIAFNVHSTTVRFETNIGDIDIELYEEQAPVTVQNFLGYVNRGDYDGTVVHRSVPGFIIQGGGYRYSGNGVFTTVPTEPPIILEAGLSNTKGTIAMARTSAPNSATNQWFFNVFDNISLDQTNTGGYAVFGQIIRGLELVQFINAMPVVNFEIAENSNNLFSETLKDLPTYFFNGEVYANSTQGIFNYVKKKSDVKIENLIKIEKAYVLSEKFQINAGLSGAWFNPDTNGQGVYLEVLPSAHLLISAWFAYDLLPPEATLKSDFGASEHRWFTLEGQYTEDSMEGIIILTEGGAFDSSEPVINSLFGSVNIQFSSCNRAVMTYEITEPAISGTIPLQRQSDVNVELCEQLAAEANQGVEP